MGGDVGCLLWGFFCLWLAAGEETGEEGGAAFEREAWAAGFVAGLERGVLVV